MADLKLRQLNLEVIVLPPLLPREDISEPGFRRAKPSYSNDEEIWSGRRGSNPRPRPWQGRALPLSYTRIRKNWRRSGTANEGDLCQMLPANATAAWPVESTRGSHSTLGFSPPSASGSG